MQQFRSAQIVQHLTLRQHTSVLLATSQHQLLKEIKNGKQEGRLRDNRLGNYPEIRDFGCNNKIDCDIEQHHHFVQPMLREILWILAW